MTTDDDDNWLHASVFPCPHCGTQLFRVDRSPFADDYRIYCDRCPNSVEFSYYDDVCLQFDRDHRTDIPDPGHRWLALRDFIEAHLRSCDCGGSYRFNAARRCPTCGQPVVVNEPWVDLYPSINGIEMEDRDPTPQEQDMYGRYSTAHMRTRDIWRRGDG